jgi:hypothetical protein
MAVEAAFTTCAGSRVPDPRERTSESAESGLATAPALQISPHVARRHPDIRDMAEQIDLVLLAGAEPPRHGRLNRKEEFLLCRHSPPGKPDAIEPLPKSTRFI